MKYLLLFVFSVMVGCGQIYTERITINIDGKESTEVKEALAKTIIEQLKEGDLKKNILVAVEGITQEDLDNGLEVERKTNVFKLFTGSDDEPTIVVQIVCTFSSPDKNIDALGIAESCKSQVKKKLELKES